MNQARFSMREIFADPRSDRDGRESYLSQQRQSSGSDPQRAGLVARWARVWRKHNPEGEPILTEEVIDAMFDTPRRRE